MAESNASKLANNILTDGKFDATDVVGNITSTGIDDNATSTAITIDSSENVGIGTISPEHALDVTSSASVPVRIQSTASSNMSVEINAPTGYNANILLKENDANAFFIGHNASDSALTFYDGTADSERMRIDSSGNLGIGTTDINTNGISLSRTQGAITRAFNNSVTDYVEFTGELLHATGVGNSFGTQDMIQINFPAPTFSSVFFDIQIMSFTANTGNSATQGSMWRLVFTRDDDDDNSNSITEYSTTSVTAGDSDPNVSLSGSYSSNVFTLSASQQTGGISHLNFKVTGFVTRVDTVYASDGQTNVSWDGRKKLVYDR